MVASRVQLLGGIRIFPSFNVKVAFAAELPFFGWRIRRLTFELLQF